jgi:AmiR/NasT family two-component response regulator
MQDGAKPYQSAVDKRSIITNAVNYLIIRHKVSPKRARQWILQEAMAKRANLDEVAEAVLCNETVNYRYSAPI